MAYWAIQILIVVSTIFFGISEQDFAIHGYVNTISFYVLKAAVFFLTTHFLIRAPIHFLRKKESELFKIIFCGICFVLIGGYLGAHIRDNAQTRLLPDDKKLAFYQENPDQDPLNKIEKETAEQETDDSSNDSSEDDSEESTFQKDVEEGASQAELEDRRALEKRANGDEDAINDRFKDRLIGQCVIVFMWFLFYLPLSALRRRTQVTNQLKQSQIALLMSQLNPHFLFNSLNSIRGMIFEDKTLAKELIDKLNELFKYNLTANKHATVKLKEELRICEFYLDIEHIRLEERLLIEMHVDETCLNYKVPTMSLLTLIENSIKHGIAPRQEQSLLLVDISKEKNLITMTVSNPVYKGNYKVESTGTGQENLLKRLQLMYSEEASLTTSEQGDKYVASLVIPV